MQAVDVLILGAVGGAGLSGGIGFLNLLAKAFTMRGYCAIASFACTIIGCYTQFTQPVNSLY